MQFIKAKNFALGGGTLADAARQRQAADDRQADRRGDGLHRVGQSPAQGNLAEGFRPAGARQAPLGRVDRRDRHDRLGDAEIRSKDILGRVYEYFLTQFASAEGSVPRPPTRTPDRGSTSGAGIRRTLPRISRTSRRFGYPTIACCSLTKSLQIRFTDKPSATFASMTARRGSQSLRRLTVGTDKLSDNNSPQEGDNPSHRDRRTTSRSQEPLFHRYQRGSSV